MADSEVTFPEGCWQDAVGPSRFGSVTDRFGSVTDNYTPQCALQFFFLVHFYLFLSCLSVCGVSTHHGMLTEVRGQLVGICSFLPTCGAQGLNSVPQTWQQTLYSLSQPTSPSFYFFSVTSQTFYLGGALFSLSSVCFVSWLVGLIWFGMQILTL